MVWKPYWPKKQFKEPERLSSAEASLRRLDNLLERERRFQEVPNFVTVRDRLEKSTGLSRALQDIHEKMPEAVEVRRRYGLKATSIVAAMREINPLIKASGFPDRATARYYQKLRIAQQEQEKAKAKPVDRRSFNPTGEYVSIYGTTARLASRVAANFKPNFAYPLHALPCVQRKERREVMFAKGYGGRGYGTRKKRSWSSGIPC